jgi:hypothetical protein
MSFWWLFLGTLDCAVIGGAALYVVAEMALKEVLRRR